MQQTHNSQIGVMYTYFNNIINFMMNIINGLLEIYLNTKKIDNKNMEWLSEINQDEIPGPYDDVDGGDQWTYSTLYDGYYGYDN